MAFSPTNIPFVDARGLISREWLAYLNTIQSTAGSASSGSVTDGSADTYGPMTLYQGAAADRPVPLTGRIFFAIDTGAIYVVRGGQWVLESPALTGDVTKPANSSVTTLATVNPAPGMYGSVTEIPVLNIDSKGRVTEAYTVPIPDGLAPAGVTGSVQYNNSSDLGGDTAFLYNSVSQQLTVPGFQTTTARLGGTNYPTVVGTDGYVLTTDGAGTASWAPTGETYWPFSYGDSTPVTIVTVPAGSLINSISVVVLTAFDDPAATISINSLFTSSDILLTQTGTYSVEPGVAYSSPTALELTISPGSSTQGSGAITINFQI